LSLVAFKDNIFSSRFLLPRFPSDRAKQLSQLPLLQRNIHNSKLATSFKTIGVVA